MSISQNFPEEGPTLNLNFASSKTLDPRITFTRTSSATYTDDSGLIRVAPINSPRFDHRFNPTTGEIESLGLLVEESRQNLTTFSEQLDNERWSVSNLTRSSNTTETTAPDGSNNAEKVLETVTNSVHSFLNFNAYGITAGTVYTASIFVKSINKQFVQLVFDDNATTNGGYVNFNLTSGTITQSANYGTGASIGGTITSYPNGWYRLSVTSTAGTTGTFGRFSINGLTSGTSGPFPGYAGNTSTGYYLWGAQLEAASFPTSYIPTAATTATRTADKASITGSNFTKWYNPSEGVLCATYSRNADKNNQMVAQIRNNDGSNRIEIRGQGITSDSFRIEVIEGGRTSQSQREFGIIPSGNAISTFHKCNLAYKQNNFASAINGTLYTDDTGVVGNCDRMIIGAANYGSSGDFNGHISQLTYYPVRLRNDILQTLTK